MLSMTIFTLTTLLWELPFRNCECSTRKIIQSVRGFTSCEKFAHTSLPLHCWKRKPTTRSMRCIWSPLCLPPTSLMCLSTKDQRLYTQILVNWGKIRWRRYKGRLGTVWDWGHQHGATRCGLQRGLVGLSSKSAPSSMNFMVSDWAVLFTDRNVRTRTFFYSDFILLNYERGGEGTKNSGKKSVLKLADRNWENELKGKGKGESGW